MPRAKAVVSKIQTDNADVKAGITIVLKGLEAPICQIAAHAGVEGSIVVAKIRSIAAEIGCSREALAQRGAPVRARPAPRPRRRRSLNHHPR